MRIDRCNGRRRGWSDVNFKALCNDKSSYVVVIPTNFRPGITLSISVNILRARYGVTVEASLRKQNVVATSSKVFRAGRPGTMKLKVPADLTSGGYTLSITGSGGLIFTNSTSITYESKSMSVFIQTDKAMYKPGQTVQFRAFATYPNLTVYTGPMDVDIRDPNTNKIKRMAGLRGSSGVINSQMVMDTKPVLGVWEIEVTCKDQSEKKEFTVAEYVLPKYEVTVELPTYVVIDDNDVTGTVAAMYTYGKPVRGKVKITAELDYFSRPWDIRNTQPLVEQTLPIDGNTTFRIPLADIKRTEPYLNNRKLIVRANVTETLTGISLNGSSSVQFYPDAVKMEFLDSNPETFKPGLKYTAYLRISQPDGRPVTGHQPDVSVLTTVTWKYTIGVGTPRLSHPPSGTYSLPRETFPVPASGVVEIQVIVPDNATEINLDVTYDRNHNLYKRLTKSYSPSDNYIQLFLRSSAVTAGQVAQFEMRSTETSFNAVYQIMSRGSIVAAEYIARSYLKTIMFSVPVTSQMAPNARIIVYYVRTDGEVVTDSISFDVDGTFQNQVSLGFDQNQVLPGGNVRLTVSADPHSFVNLLAVDQSVLLLKTGNDVTQSEVIDELKTYDTIKETNSIIPGPFLGGGVGRPMFRRKRSIFFPYPRYYGGSDAGQIFDNAGVKVLTDANIHRHKRSPPRFVPMPMGSGPMPAMAVQHSSAPRVPVAPIQTDGLKEVSKTRSIFPETWLWSNITTSADGTASIQTTIPDTITSWVATAFAVNSQTGLGITQDSVSVKAFQPFFVSLTLPYSVVQGEQVVLQANVFNYLPQTMTVVVTLDRSDHFQSIRVDASGVEIYLSVQEMSTLIIPSGEAKTVNFAVVPVRLGKIPIQVRAQSTDAADAVRRQLLVEPEGVPKDYNTPVMVDLKESNTFTRTIPLTLPANTVSGSQRTRISAIGDVMGPTINGIDKLLTMPTGCGEQTMVGFAPDVFISNYLLATNQLTGDIKDKAVTYMEKGYQRELTYQHRDGSFSAFGDSDDSGSMWLTAFVVKSFHQAKPHIFIDDDILVKAIDWMISRQSTNGSFPEPGRVIHKDMQGASATGSSLTAFVLIALLENNDLQGSISQRIAASVQKAGTFLTAQTITDTYELAITSYALTKAGNPTASDMFTRLNARAIVEDGMKHWHKPEAPSTSTPHWRPPHQQSRSADIEMTAYALLVYTSTNDLTGGIPVMKWITTQRNSNGGFRSTQDTVLGLQALSEFATSMFSNSGSMHITVTAGNVTHEFDISRQNALILQSFEIPTVPGNVDVSATGSGLAVLEVAVYFNVEEDIEEPSFGLSVQLSDETLDSMKVQTCVRWLKPGSSGMAVEEFGVPSGFEVNLDSIGRLSILKKIEVEDRKIVLYFDEIDSNQICITFEVVRIGMVAKSQPVAVRIYDYYEPANQVTKFYMSQRLKDASICDICSDCGCAATSGREEVNNA
ncbi:hypothetical protein ScPMuIL_005963 [Solemya velum]